MRADERQAAVGYAYAWWMTGDDDAAAAALRTAMAAPDPAGDGDSATLIALMTAVRAALGDTRPMPPASELALLHDGFGVPLQPAAELAAVPAAGAADHLAHGRLEALLETVREDFRHPERLGGLATGNQADLSHAEDCRSCTRAATLIARGGQELREVSPVSAPAGLIPGLVAQYAPPPTPDVPPVVEVQTPADVDAGTEIAAETDAVAETDAEAEAEAPEATDDTISVHDVLPGPRDYAVAGDDVDHAATPQVDTPSVEELEAMLADAPAEVPAPADLDEPDVEIDLAEPEVVEAPTESPAVETDAPPEAAAPPEAPAPEAPEAPELEPEAPERDLVPTTPARKRAAGVFAVTGIVAASALVVALVASGAPEDVPPVDDVTEQPALRTEGQSERPRPERSERPFGPKNGRRKGFSVASAGLLLSGSEDIAPSGTTIGRQDALRVAVDYENAAKGVSLVASWRVDGKLYRRLEAVVSSRASRHVWGMPVPAKGWEPGRHRIVVTADDSVAAAVDFTVRAGE